MDKQLPSRKKEGKTHYLLKLPEIMLIHGKKQQKYNFAFT